MLRLLLVTVALLLTLAPGAAVAAQPPGEVTVRRGAEGTPHIKATTYEGLGYGFARSHAEDNLCVLADVYVTVAAERSRFFGPDETYKIRNTNTTPNNLNSDFFWGRVIEDRVVEKLVEQRHPVGPDDRIRALVRGYTEGYNDYVREQAANVRDPECAGKEWVRPIREIDVWRRFYFLAVLASQMAGLDGIGGAQPPTPALPTADEGAAERTAQSLAPGTIDRSLHDFGVGSNAIALGSQATDNGKGMLLGNPHQPWQGSERFYQSHLTIPGEIDVQGGSLYGVPIVNIGHTKDLAWSHTVSTARRFAIYELQLVPGSPTTYLQDGRPKEMRRTTVTVQARRPDGSLEPRTRTLYATDKGPMVTSIVGLPLFPWTSARAFSMFDANNENFGRLLNHFFDTNRASSVDELDGILRRYLGIPWVNTIAADRKGKALYADVGSVPGVPDAKVADCSTAVGRALDGSQRIQVLDGTRAQCDPDSAPGTPNERILPADAQPALIRDDYTENSNDSHWLSNARTRLEGFPRIIGEERTVRSLRTRLGFRLIEDELAGGGRFTLSELQDAAFNNRQFAGELWRDELVEMCRTSPGVPAEACDVLARWEVRDDLDSRGALLFRRFAERALTGAATVFDVPFDPEDPIGTPRGLNTENPAVRSALPAAIEDLRQAGVSFDAPLSALQYEERGERIPLHGGSNVVGLFNVIVTKFSTEKGYTDVEAGATYVQAVQFTDGACPVEPRTVLAHSQSTDPTSPFFANGTKLFSRKEWVDMPFCERDVLARTRLTGRFGRAAGTTRKRRGARRQTLLRDIRVLGTGRRARLSFRLTQRARVQVTVTRGRRVVRRVRVTRKAGRHVVRLRLGRSQAYRVRLSARGRTKRASVVRLAGERRP
jgi:acyl-homoserine-lactone acylase